MRATVYRQPCNERKVLSMKKILSLVLALLMLGSVIALSACNKVEPMKIKVIVNVAEEKNGRKTVTETILDTDYDYTSSAPTISDLLVQLDKDGKITLNTETLEDESVKITGINGLAPKQEDTGDTIEDYAWYVYINDGAYLQDGLAANDAVAAGNTITFTYMNYTLDKE